MINWDKLNKDVSEIAEKYGLDVDPNLRMIDASVGIQQRTEILKTLYRNADILILDEPTAGVDVRLRQDMWRLVGDLRRSGVTIILTTHYIEEAEEIADRVGVINKGEIVVVEKKSELMRKLGKKQLTLELFTKLEYIPKQLADFKLELARNGSQLIYTYDTQAERTGITTLLRELHDANIKFKDLSTTQSSLEDIFVALVIDEK